MALVVRDDSPENDTLPKADGVVLDALPYVEPLDPNYEQYAISLIEDELQHTLNEQATNDPSAFNANGEIGEHPALCRLLPSSLLGKTSGGNNSSISTQTPDFGGKAPYAAATYQSLLARRGPDGSTAPDTNTDWTKRPDPIAQNGGKINFDGANEETIISNLNTSIATSKIQLEQERLRLVNLELHQQFDNSRRWMEYHSQLENHYVAPMSDAVAQQRLKVDGINAGRMEEQEVAARKLQGLYGRFDQLVDKNYRLGKAIAGLENEVESLRKVAGVDSLEGKTD